MARGATELVVSEGTEMLGVVQAARRYSLMSPAPSRTTNLSALSYPLDDQQAPSRGKTCVRVRHRASGCIRGCLTTPTLPPEAHPIAELPTSMSRTPSDYEFLRSQAAVACDFATVDTVLFAQVLLAVLHPGRQPKRVLRRALRTRRTAEPHNHPEPTGPIARPEPYKTATRQIDEGSWSDGTARSVC